MATTNHNNSEEIELGVLFKGIKRFLKKILILIYRFIQFLIRSWIVILILILLGAVTGYFFNKIIKPSQETVLIVQTNFNSTNYVDPNDV